MKKHRFSISVFFRFLFSFSAVTLISLLMIGYVSYSNAITGLNREIEDSYRYQLGQVTQYIDEQLNKLYLSAWSIATDTKLNPRIMQYNAYNEIEGLQELVKYQDAHSIAVNCLLYAKGGQVVYTYDGKYDKDIYTAYEFNLTDWETFYEDLDAAGAAYIRSSLVQYPGSASSERVLLYVCPVSTKASRQSDLVVVYMLTAKTIRSGIDNLLGGLVPGLYMADDQSQLLYAFNGLPAGTDAPEFPLELPASDRSMASRGGYSYFTGSSSEYGIHYVLTVPSSVFLERAADYRNLMTVILVATAVVAIGAGLLIAYINYKPIRQMSRMVATAVPEIAAGRNELDSISRALTGVFHDNDVLRGRIVEQDRMLHFQALSRVLSGTWNEDILSELKGMGITFDFPAFGVVVLAADPAGLSDTTAVDEYFNTVESLFGAECTAYCVELRIPGRIAVLCNLPFEDEAGLADRCRHIGTRCMELFHLQVRFGVGGVYASPQRINASFSEAVSCLSHTGGGSVVVFHDISGAYSTLPGYPLQPIAGVMNNIRLGETRNALSYLEEITALTACASPLDIVNHCVCHDIVGSLLNLSRELDLRIPIESLSVLLDCRSTDKLVPLLRVLVPDLCDQVRAGIAENENRMIREIIGYVDDHCLSYDLSLETLAGRFNLSTFHISRLFKEVHGIGFKEYVIHQRMRVAREMLADNSMTIKEISQRVGYANSSHFIKTFKSIENITPSKYRKLHGS